MNGETHTICNVNIRIIGVCAIACVFPNDSKKFVIRGECYGKIIDDRRGTAGFGYDPYFYYEPFGETFAEIELAKKNEVSHRGEAVRKFIKEFSRVISNDK